ncbi:hypothetical protein DIPPA_35067 [Diplonema papillatum]|nr:hypothetical protein DIPPA_35067 [Diplonema papillatum]
MSLSLGGTDEETAGTLTTNSATVPDCWDSDGADSSDTTAAGSCHTPLSDVLVTSGPNEADPNSTATTLVLSPVSRSPGCTSTLYRLPSALLETAHRAWASVLTPAPANNSQMPIQRASSCQLPHAPARNLPNRTVCSLPAASLPSSPVQGRLVSPLSLPDRNASFSSLTHAATATIANRPAAGGSEHISPLSRDSRYDRPSRSDGPAPAQQQRTLSGHSPPQMIAPLRVDPATDSALNVSRQKISHTSLCQTGWCNEACVGDKQPAIVRSTAASGGVRACNAFGCHWPFDRPFDEQRHARCSVHAAPVDAPGPSTSFTTKSFFSCRTARIAGPQLVAVAARRLQEWFRGVLVRRGQQVRYQMLLRVRDAKRRRREEAEELDQFASKIQAAWWRYIACATLKYEFDADDC